MNLHGVKVFNLHVVILYLCQDHSLNQYKNKYSSLIEHLCNIYFTFRSIYQKQIYGIMQHIYDMENFSPNLQAVSTLLKKKKTTVCFSLGIPLAASFSLDHATPPVTIRHSWRKVHGDNTEVVVTTKWFSEKKSVRSRTSELFTQKQTIPSQNPSQGNSRACIDLAEHVCYNTYPGYSYKQVLTLLRMKTSSAWSTVLKKVSVQQNLIELPYHKQQKTDSSEQQALGGLARSYKDRTCKQQSHWDCSAQLSALRGSLWLPKEENQFKILSSLHMHSHFAQITADFCKKLHWIPEGGELCHNQSIGLWRDAPWQQMPLFAEPCCRVVPKKHVFLVPSALLRVAWGQLHWGRSKIHRAQHLPPPLFPSAVA